tara:strand:+ start:2526 stop:3062 length:537 start_codon:yes stop_codon:yes gene_type:complete
MTIHFGDSTSIDSGGSLGKILQVKQAYKTDVFSSTSSGTHNVTGLSVSITPASSSNKILVLADVGGHTHNGMGGSFQIKRTISSSSTTIGLANSASNRQRSSFSGTLYTGDGGGANFIVLTANTKFLDSPNTTSAITYQVAMVQISTALYCVNRSEFDSDTNDYTRTVSNITVMEVSA